uniref:Uncharacterized protein n=1 Tax=Electrophorus electricus TaxID=8005 RepID=A0AAY5EXA1_ELEEL
MMCSKSIEWLQLELDSGTDGSFLLLDCCSHQLYELFHIETAINLDNEKFIRWCKTDTVILTSKGSVLALVLQKLWDEGGYPFSLKVTSMFGNNVSK